MSSPPHNEDTLPVYVRRLGSGRVHCASVPSTALFPASHWGSAFTGISPPIVARCGATLRGDTLVVIPPGEALDSLRHTGAGCRPCEWIAGGSGSA